MRNEVRGCCNFYQVTVIGSGKAQMAKELLEADAIRKEGEDCFLS